MTFAAIEVDATGVECARLDRGSDVMSERDCRLVQLLASLCVSACVISPLAFEPASCDAFSTQFTG